MRWSQVTPCIYGETVAAWALGIDGGAPAPPLEVPPPEPPLALVLDVVSFRPLAAGFAEKFRAANDLHFLSKRDAGGTNLTFESEEGFPPDLSHAEFPSLSSPVIAADWRRWLGIATPGLMCVRSHSPPSVIVWTKR
jgi:hypothetical protein